MIDPVSVLVKSTMMIPSTIQFVQAAMAGIVDKAGEPISDHCIRVAGMLGPEATENEKLVALMHDLLEDTDITARMLREMGYPREVVEAVVILTNKPEREYFEYVRSIVASGNPIALKVKMADNLDNGSPARLFTLDEATRERLGSRYRRAWRILTLQEK